MPHSMSLVKAVASLSCVAPTFAGFINPEVSFLQTRARLGNEGPLTIVAENSLTLGTPGTPPWVTTQVGSISVQSWALSGISTNVGAATTANPATPLEAMLVYGTVVRFRFDVLNEADLRFNIDRLATFTQQSNAGTSASVRVTLSRPGDVIELWQPSFGVVPGNSQVSQTFNYLIDPGNNYVLSFFISGDTRSMEAGTPASAQVTDEFRFGVQVVPSPATMPLLGAAALASMRRRRR